VLGSSPSDLAVAFRSFGRRLHEAVGEAPVDALGPAGDLQRLMDRVADWFRVDHGTEVDATGAAIADAIEARPAKAWTKDDLRRLQDDALEAGRLLRLLEHGP
jgi:hypothetical protein